MCELKKKKSRTRNKNQGIKQWQTINHNFLLELCGLEHPLQRVWTDLGSKSYSINKAVASFLSTSASLSTKWEYQCILLSMLPDFNKSVQVNLQCLVCSETAAITSRSNGNSSSKTNTAIEINTTILFQEVCKELLL